MSKSKYIICPKCDSIKIVCTGRSFEECSTCNGTGKIKVDK